MITNVLMPKLYEGQETGRVIRWLKKEGDAIKAGDVIAEIETERANVEIEAFGAGVLHKIVVRQKSQALAGAVIAIISDGRDDVPSVLGAVAATALTPPIPPPGAPVGSRAVPRGSDSWSSRINRVSTFTATWVPIVGSGLANVAEIGTRWDEVSWLLIVVGFVGWGFSSWLWILLVKRVSRFLERRFDPGTMPKEIPWAEVGSEAGRRLLPLVEEFLAKFKNALQEEQGERPLSVGDLDSPRWKYELCLLMMFFHWYAAHAARLHDAGATEAFYHSCYSACRQALFEQLLGPGEENARRLDCDIAERFKAYDDAWRVDLARKAPDAPHPVTGEIGWTFARFLSDGQEADPRLAMLIRVLAGQMFIYVAGLVEDVERKGQEKSD